MDWCFDGFERMYMLKVRGNDNPFLEGDFMKIHFIYLMPD